MRFRIAVLPGDGIGPEVIAQGVKALKATAVRFGHDFELDYRPVGAEAIDKIGVPLPSETLAACIQSDSVLLGAVGDPRFAKAPLSQRPERGLIDLRRQLGITVSLRFTKVYPALVNATRFKPEAIQNVDIVTVRDPIGVSHERPEGQEVECKSGTDQPVGEEEKIRRIMRIAFEVARNRRKMLVSVGRFSVDAFSKFWREVAEDVGEEYSDVDLRFLPPDSACAQLVLNPASLDVVVSDDHTVGGILDDLAAALGGSLGMSPSAELRATRRNVYGNFGLHEPIHGSAPKYTGLDRVNPIGTIRSVSTMLTYSLGKPEEAMAIEAAVASVLKTHRTRDTMEAGKTMVGTQQMGDLIAEAIIATRGAMGGGA